MRLGTTRRSTKRSNPGNYGRALTEINIHIGTHGIASTFVADVFERSDSIELSKWFTQITPRQFRRNLRPAVNATRPDDVQARVQAARTTSLVRGIGDRDNEEKLFVLSQHNLLSGDQHTSSNGVFYPKGHTRVENLSTIFSEHEIHFTIIVADLCTWFQHNVHDLKTEQDLADIVSDQTSHSWVELIKRLRRHASCESFRVWGLSRPLDKIEPLTQIFFSPGSRGKKLFSRKTGNQLENRFSHAPFAFTVSEALRAASIERFKHEMETLKDEIDLKVEYVYPI